jgi:hypothetical protein
VPLHHHAPPGDPRVLDNAPAAVLLADRLGRGWKRGKRVEKAECLIDNHHHY